MKYSTFTTFVFLFCAWTIPSSISATNNLIPLIVTTWDFKNATEIAWNTIYDNEGSAIDALEDGCSYCEDTRCLRTVGYGGSPDENGETTLDAMLMDGATMDVGGIAGLRNVKHAISVARHVLENTVHSLLAGNLATDFAIKMGFANESLQTEESHNVWKKWKNRNCQPNFWKNVSPEPKTTCGPYLARRISKYSRESTNEVRDINKDNHDTIGMIAIDSKGRIASGTSTNGRKHKIAGRVGDSPIAGAGSYADQEVGAAAATGDGDTMMRFLPSFLAVERMRQGDSPTLAAETAIRRISKHYPKFEGAVIALNKEGQYGAACNGMNDFPFYARNLQLGAATIYHVKCLG